MVMSNMVFKQKWLKWFKWCNFTTSFSVLVNDTPIDFFRSLRGLRKGNPLSIYLVVIAMEALSSLLVRAPREGSCRVLR